MKEQPTQNPWVNCSSHSFGWRDPGVQCPWCELYTLREVLELHKAKAAESRRFKTLKERDKYRLALERIMATDRDQGIDMHAIAESALK